MEGRHALGRIAIVECFGWRLGVGRAMITNKHLGIEMILFVYSDECAQSLTIQLILSPFN